MGVKRQQGFSLLEVMVAFVLMGMIVAVLLQLFGGGMRSVALSDEYSYAVQVAESQMATVGREIVVEPGRTSGSDAGYDWDVQIEPYEFELPEDASDMPVNIFPYIVSVDVSWKSGDKERHLNLQSLRFGEES